MRQLLAPRPRGRNGRRRVLILVMLAAVVAAGTVSVASSHSAAKTRIALFVSITSYNNPAYEYVKKKYGAQVSIDRYSPDFDSRKQVGQCQDVLNAKRYQAWIINPVDGASLVPCVKKAIQAGVKVVSWNYPPIGRDPNGERIQVPGLVGLVLLSLRLDVSAAMTMLRRACAGRNPCKVAMLIGEATYGYSAYKRNFTLAALKKYPSIKLVSQSITGFDNPAKVQQAVTTILQKTPDVHVIIGDDDSGMPGAERALKAAGATGKVKLIGDGANKFAVQAIRDGRMYGTVLALPRSSLTVATKLALDAVNGRPITRRIFIDQLLPSPCKNAIVDRTCAKKLVAEW